MGTLLWAGSAKSVAIDVAKKSPVHRRRVTASEIVMNGSILGDESSPAGFRIERERIRFAW
jgi:Na+/H+ antiporter NhaC